MIKRSDRCIWQFNLKNKQWLSGCMKNTSSNIDSFKFCPFCSSKIMVSELIINE